VIPLLDGRPERRRVVLFLLAGAANTLFGYIAFGALILAGLHHAVAVAGSTIAGILFNFQTFGLVFADTDPRRFLRFVGVYALLFALNVGLLNLLVGAGLHALLAQALVVPALATLSFLLMRSLVFAPMPSREACR